MDENIVKKLIGDALSGIAGAWKVKLGSRKFIAYIAANVLLMVAGFAKLVSSDDFAGIFKIVTIGYWGTQGGIDAIKELGNILQKKRNGNGGTVIGQ